MKKTLKLVLLLLCLFEFNNTNAQVKFNCQLQKIDLKLCQKKGDERATKVSESIYAISRDSEIDNTEEYRSCSNVQTFIAAKEAAGNTKVIFFPKKFLTSSTPNWAEQGQLLHAIAHFQLGHDSDTLNAYQKELAADTRAAALLMSAGANYIQARQYIDQSPVGSSKMPSKLERLKVLEYTYPSPKAKFDYKCSSPNCTEPCQVVFTSTSEYVPFGTRFFWNRTEAGSSVTWQESQTKAGSYQMKLLVISPDGRRDSTYKNIVIMPRRYSPPPPPPPTPLTKWKFGFQAGVSYSSYFDVFDFTGGVVTSYHPDLWGFQGEINYVSSNDGFYESDFEYDPIWKGYDIYSARTEYQINNIELATLVIFGRDKGPKIGFNLLAGVGLRYGLGGNKFYDESIYYANGTTDGYFDFAPIYFYDDYKRVRANVQAGFTVGSDRFCIGGRIDAELPTFYAVYPHFRMYAMLRF